ncbi:threonine synthase [Corallococcus sp. CA049B]|uniref:threonine synthase n=1 Tax=Corallococcus sp. CA049B TaxID=2316730 RepID=UPI000EA2EB70|nr:threonine synthase [Corallococcus sp. CA049B]RKG85013.1 threonine synthase [Corallococcus sp. CA049B]
MLVSRLECTKCDQTYAPGKVWNLCTACQAPLFARYDLERAAKTLRKEALPGRERSMWRYHEVLPVDDPGQRLTLGEGFTPLLPAPRLGSWLGLPRVWVKDESGNPTGSFKARGLSAAVSMAKALGAKAVCLPSAGNAGSALAAYAARGGMEAHVFVPKDIASLFLMETRAYGAHVETVEGLISDAGRVCAGLAKEHGWYECATLKEPYRVEGKKTMGYELAEQLGWTLPDVILYPTGGGTGLIGMWKAFDEMETMGLIDSKRPRMVAVQAEGCAPIVKAHAEGKPDAPMWQGATTHAHGLRVPKALGDFLILRAVKHSHGTAVSVTEEEIVQGTKDAAAAEGLFMAPEGGACVAALKKLQAAGEVKPEETVVVFNTGTGFKYVENMAPLW